MDILNVLSEHFCYSFVYKLARELIIHIISKLFFVYL